MEIITSVTGVGKVNTAIGTTVLIKEQKVFSVSECLKSWNVGEELISDGSKERWV